MSGLQSLRKTIVVIKKGRKTPVHLHLHYKHSGGSIIDQKDVGVKVGHYRHKGGSVIDQKDVGVKVGHYQA